MRKMREADLIIENDDKGEPGGRVLPSYLVLQVGNLQMVQEHSLKRGRESEKDLSVQILQLKPTWKFLILVQGTHRNGGKKNHHIKVGNSEESKFKMRKRP